MGKRGPGASPSRRHESALLPVNRDHIMGINSRAGRVIAWIETLRVPAGQHAGKRFKLRPWQRQVIRSVYNDRRVRLVLVSMARKNGKTALAAALALCHLAGPEAVTNGQVISAAADRGQAALIFDFMAQFAAMDAELTGRLNFKNFHKQIEDARTGSKYSALSSDARKAHGLSPNFWIADELAQWRGRELLDGIRTGAGAHATPLGWIISTRSPDPASPLEEFVKYAADIEAGAFADRTFKAFIWSAPVDAAPWAEDTWKLANPGLGDFRSLEDIRAQAAQAQRLPSLEPSFRAYMLNQPVAADDRWVAPADWEACSGVGEPRGPVWGGLDLASGAADLSAFALYWPETGRLTVTGFIPADLLADKERQDQAPYGAWAAQGHIVIVPGRVVDRAWLGQWIARQTEALELQAIASDRWLIEDLKAQLDREGLSLPLKPHGAGFKDVSPSLTALEALILDGKLRHGGSPLLRWAANNAVVDLDPAGNRKFSKMRATGRIDPLIAGLFAVGLASRQPATPTFEFTGMLI